MHKDKIIFVGKKDAALVYLAEQLRSCGIYNIGAIESFKEALSFLRKEDFGLVVLEASSSDPQSISFIQECRRLNEDAVIIVLIAEERPDIFEYLLSLGVYEVMIKPINLERFLFLVKKGLDLRKVLLTNRKFIQGLREQNLTLEKQNIILSKRIEESAYNLTRLYEDLRSTYLKTIKVLAQAIDARDHYTHSHSENVARFATLIATEMGLSAKEIEIIRQACELHDLGKIGIADEILMKPSALNPAEREKIKKHPGIGAKILEPLTFLNEVVELVRQHHERFDGSGYPEGRRKEEILLGARIINLADAYEAMRSARSYRKIPLTKEEAITEIKKNSGKQFDPKVVEAFLRIADKL